MPKKAICLISDGLDSPVATFLLEQKGLQVIGIHFNNRPFVGESKYQKSRVRPSKDLLIPNKKPYSLQIENIANKLVHSFQSQQSFDLYIVPHGEDLGEIINNSEDEKITCVLCKRLMLKKAEYFANQIGATLIATGDILGEQASQTIDNLKLVENALSNTRLIRPNIGLNKEEVISISRKIGTYQHSELAAKFTCTAVPIKPVTKAADERIELAEAKLDFDKLIEKSWEKAQKISFSKSNPKN